MAKLTFEIARVDNPFYELPYGKVFYIMDPGRPSLNGQALNMIGRVSKGYFETISLTLSVVNYDSMMTSNAETYVKRNYPNVNSFKRYFIKRRLLKDASTSSISTLPFAKRGYLVARIFPLGDFSGNDYVICNLEYVSGFGSEPFCAALSKFTDYVEWVSIGNLAYQALLDAEKASSEMPDSVTTACDADVSKEPDVDTHVRFSREINNDLFQDMLLRERLSQKKRVVHEPIVKDCGVPEEAKLRLPADFIKATLEDKVKMFMEMGKYLSREMGMKDVVAQIADNIIISNKRNPQIQLSRLSFTDKDEIFLNDYNQIVKITTISRALYILFLLHPEGINLKDLIDYRSELLEIYQNISARECVETLNNTVDNLIADPYVCLSRLKAPFQEILPTEILQHYLPIGARGKNKTISLPRELITLPSWCEKG